MNNRLGLYLIAFLSLFLIAACQTPSVSGEHNKPIDTTKSPKDACLAKGGMYTKQGRLQSYHCVMQFSDAGKSCSDSAQCQGSCTSSDIKIEAGTSNVTGTCAANDSPFGCHQTIENGVAKGFLCID